MNLYMNVDPGSIHCLWLRILGTGENSMPLDRLRLLVETLLSERCEIRVSASDYSQWTGQLLMLVEADETTGVVSRHNFIELFPLWHSSRVWFIPRDLSPVENILKAWDLLDVSNCGVLSRSTITDILLPYAFRVMYPESSHDDSALRAVWIDLMNPLIVGTKTQWVNHWSEFKLLNPINFHQASLNELSREGIADLFLSAFNVQKSSFLLDALESMASLAGGDGRARALTLWLVTIPHGRQSFTPVPSAEFATDIKPFFASMDELRTICKRIWGLYLPHTGTPFDKFFELWLTNTIAAASLSGSADTPIVLRKSLLARFLSDDEVNSLWERFVGSAVDVITDAQLVRLFRGVYRATHPEGSYKGDWVIRSWIHDLSFLADATHPSIYKGAISREGFRVAFPIVFAAISPTVWHTPEAGLVSIWPETSGEKLVYSKPFLRNLLRMAWDNYVPYKLNIPCQEWWLDKCAARLCKAGGGVSRKMFYDLFPSPEEVNRITIGYKRLTATTLGQILNNCVDREYHKEEHDGLIPTNYIQEFFLITDVPAVTSAVAFDLDPKVFNYAFPLWFAANYNNYA